MFRTTSLLLLLAGSAAAQTTASVPAGIPPAPDIRTAADTVQAVHRIFAKHRRIGTFIVFGAVGADLALAGVSAAMEPTPKRTGGGGYGLSGPIGPHDFGTYAALYTLLALPIIGVGVEQHIAYSSGREAKVIAAYETQRRLPASISRKLKRYLREE